MIRNKDILNNNAIAFIKEINEWCITGRTASEVCLWINDIILPKVEHILKTQQNNKKILTKKRNNMNRLLEILERIDENLMELSKLFYDQKIKDMFVLLATNHHYLKETIKEIMKNLKDGL